MSGRRCLLRVGCRRESSLLPIWRWGGRDLALLQSSETSDGKANRCGCVWKKKKCHKLLLSYLTSNDLSQLQLLQIQKIFPKKKKKKMVETQNKKPWDFVSQVETFCICWRKLPSYPVRIQTIEPKAWWTWTDSLINNIICSFFGNNDVCRIKLPKLHTVCIPAAESQLRARQSHAWRLAAPPWNKAALRNRVFPN